MKRTLALVLALVMAIGLMAFPVSADFKDDAEIKYTEAVDVMSAMGVINGFEDGSFDPDGYLTREPAAKVVAYLMLGAEEADALGAVSAPFDDVAANRWSAGYIAYCVNEGIINGRSETTFDPTGNVTGYEEDTKTTWSLVNRTKFDFNELAGYIGPHKGFAGIVADSKKLIISTLDLAEYQVTPADFFEQNGRYYVNAKGRTYQVADQVECYKTAVDSWFSEETGVERLRACIAFSSDLTVYVDPIGNKVRIVTAD